MLSELRKPFLIAAFVTCLLSLFLQLGTNSFLKYDTHNLTSMLNNISAESEKAFPELVEAKKQYTPPAKLSNPDKPPGIGIIYLSLIEMLILFSLGLMLMSLTIGPRLQGRLQGISVLVFSIFVIVLAIMMIIKAIAQLTIMISLFVAVPFGTIVYLGLYGSFNTGLSQAILGLLLILKITLFFFLIAAHQKYIQNSGLMRLLIVSIITIFVTTFLHMIVPGILVSITDAIAALITALLALVGAITFLVSSIPGLVKTLRLDRA